MRGRLTIVASGYAAATGRRRARRSLVLLAVFTVVTAIVSMGLGHYPLSPLAVLEVLWSTVSGRPATPPSVVENVVLAAMLVGASLAAAGRNAPAYGR